MKTPRLSYSERCAILAQLTAGLLASGHYSTDEDGVERVYIRTTDKGYKIYKLAAVETADDILDEVEGKAQAMLEFEAEEDEEAGEGVSGGGSADSVCSAAQAATKREP